MRTLGQCGWLLCCVISGAAAVAQSAASLDLAQRAELRGYKVREIRWDAVLQQRWAVLESVGHPERPYLAELTDASVAEIAAANERHAEEVKLPAPVKPAEVVIHYGDAVTAWSVDKNVRMQMVAVAESSAAVGGEIRLRVKGAGVNGESGWRLTGIVRGPGSVEIK